MAAAHTLRMRHGSRPEVAKVYCFDQSSGTALVLLKYGDGSLAAIQAEAEELEATNARGALVEVGPVLLAAAREVINRS